MPVEGWRDKRLGEVFIVPAAPDGTSGAPDTRRSKTDRSMRRRRVRSSTEAVKSTT
jgi:hypothetical protein